MIFTADIIEAINSSVLCWLATVDAGGQPNVSPKEIFAIDKDKLIIANIMSPGSEQNIKDCPLVSVSFVNILVQKGFQLKGYAEVIEKTDTNFEALHSILGKMTQNLFTIKSIFSIEVTSSKKILAPSYVFYPNQTSEAKQIKAAKKQYNL